MQYIRAAARFKAVSVAVIMLVSGALFALNSTRKVSAPSEQFRQRASEAVARDEPERSIDDLDEALKVELNNARACFDRGSSWQGKQEHERAIAEYTRAIEIDPTFSRAFSNRGASRQSLGDFDGAISDFTEALRIDPSYIQAISYRGYAWQAKGEHEKAIIDLDEGIRLGHVDAFTYYIRGQSWQAKGEHEKAEADFANAAQLDPAYSNPNAPIAPTFILRQDFSEGGPFVTGEGGIFSATLRWPELGSKPSRPE